MAVILEKVVSNMAQHKNEDNILMMFNRFYHMCKTKEQRTLVLDMKYAFLEIPAADVVPKSEWISVEDRLPEPNTNVLLYAFFHNQWQIVKGWHSYCDKKFHIVNSDYPSLTDVPVTHWMPLPEAPKMKGGEE